MEWFELVDAIVMIEEYKNWKNTREYHSNFTTGGEPSHLNSWPSVW